MTRTSQTDTSAPSPSPSRETSPSPSRETSPSGLPRVPAIGVFLPSMTTPGHSLGDMRAAARHVEDLGLESAWVVDQLVAGTGAPFLDSTVALATAAAVTSRIRL